MIKTFDLTNKVVLITGGYGYLGKAITESLIFHGAIVYVLGRDKSKFKEAFKTMPLEGVSNLHFSRCDVGITDQIIDSFKYVYEEEGRIDVLINNAIYSKGISPEKMTDEEWTYGIEGVLNSVFKCIREIIPYFKRMGKGNIINVSSMYGLIAPQFEIYNNNPAFLNPPHYGAAKAAILQLTRYYASYLGPLHINVNAVTPGPFPSYQVQTNEAFISELEKKTVLGRIGFPEDLAGAFVFLTSEAANFITGQNLIVDGGWTCK